MAVSNRLAGVRIGVDGYNLALARGTGVKTYARTLTHCLREMGCKIDILYGYKAPAEASALLQEIAFYDPDGARPRSRWRKWHQFRDALAAPFGVPAHVVDLTGRVIDREVAESMPSFDRVAVSANVFNRALRHFRRWGQFLKVRLPDPPAIMHWTYPLPIEMAGTRNIYTVHDLVPLKLPFTTLDDKGFYLKLIEGCLRRGDHICTVSERSKADIMDLFGTPAEHISNTYQSVALPKSAQEQTEAAAREIVGDIYGFGWKGYFLFFGAIEPKKNVWRLIEAVLNADVDRPLVIVGNAAWSSSEEAGFLEDYERAVALTGARRRLFKFGYLPADHLVALTKGARAVMFPSLYEGFGLPILEAMLMGTPVLTSTEGATPEIAGSAALLVDPYDVDALAAAIRRLDQDDALCDDLSRLGPDQARHFGIAPYSERLDGMYAKVLALPVS